MNLEGFPRMPKGCKGRKSKPKWPYNMTKRVLKRSQNSLKRLTLSVLVVKVDFQRVFSRIWKPFIPERLPKA